MNDNLLFYCIAIIAAALLGTIPALLLKGNANNEGWKIKFVHAWLIEILAFVLTWSAVEILNMYLPLLFNETVTSIIIYIVTALTFYCTNFFSLYFLVTQQNPEFQTSKVKIIRKIVLWTMLPFLCFS